MHFLKNLYKLPAQGYKSRVANQRRKDWSCFHTAADFRRFQIGHGMDSKSQGCLNSIKRYIHISFQEAFLMRCFANSFQSPLLHCMSPHFSLLLCPEPWGCRRLSLPLTWAAELRGTRAFRRECLAPAPFTVSSSSSHFYKVFPEHRKNNSVALKLFWARLCDAMSTKPPLLNAAPSLHRFCCCGE